jgi:hypothetical protein
VKVIEIENTSFFRAAPWNYVFVDWPRKNTATVGAQEVVGSDRPTEGNYSVDGIGGILKIDQLAIMVH